MRTTRFGGHHQMSALGGSFQGVYLFLGGVPSRGLPSEGVSPRGCTFWGILGILSLQAPKGTWDQTYPTPRRDLEPDIRTPRRDIGPSIPLPSPPWTE